MDVLKSILNESKYQAIYKQFRYAFSKFESTRCMEAIVRKEESKWAVRKFVERAYEIFWTRDAYERAKYDAAKDALGAKRAITSVCISAEKKLEHIAAMNGYAN